MAESMHLDSTDLGGSLDAFENLEHISGDFDINQESIEDTKDILRHNENAMDMMEVHPKESLNAIKEEIIEKMDEEEMDEHGEEMIISTSDINTVIGKVNVRNILSVDGNESGLESSQDLFSGDIIEEVVGSEEQIEEDSKMYEDMDTIDHFVEEEVISETVNDHIEEIVTEDVITEETVIDDGSDLINEQEVVSSQDMTDDTVIEEIVKTEPIPVSSKMVTPGVYVVATSNSNIVSSQSFLPKGTAGRLIMSPVDGSSTGGQTIRLVATGGPSQNDDLTPITTSGQTIRIVTSGSATGTSKVVKNTARTITLAEARQMGLITSAKINTLLPTTILPKPNATSNLKASTVVTTSPGSQVIRIPAGQTLNNIHQIQLPGKQVQYVKLVNAGSKAGNQTDSSGTKQIPVAFTGSLLNPQPTTFKLLSIATTPGGGQRVLIPASSQPVVSVGQSSSTQSTGGNLVVLPTHVIQAATASPSTPTSSASTQQTVSLTPQSPQPQSTVKKEVIAPKASPPTPSPSPSPATPASVKPVQANGRKASLSSSSSGVNVPTPIKTKEVIVPAGGGTGSLSISAKNDSTSGIIIKTEPETKPIKESWSPEEAQPQTFEPNGIRPRKPCNCTKSMCLKLYCDCFANGEFCHQCNCTCCYNNLEHEEERQRAIKLCLERNPTAFRPKIGKSYLGSEERRHNKGCNCRRSGCLKNYCECYEAKIPCSKNCKCVGCKNVDSPFVMRRDDDPRVMSNVSGSSGGTLLRLIKAERESAAHSRSNPSPAYLSSIKQAYRMMSNEVVEATCQCLLAQAEDWERDNGDQVEGSSNSPSLDVAQSLILEEFSRCLVQIVDCVTKSTASIQGMT